MKYINIFYLLLILIIICLIKLTYNEPFQNNDNENENENENEIQCFYLSTLGYKRSFSNTPNILFHKLDDVSNFVVPNNKFILVTAWGDSSMPSDSSKKADEILNSPNCIRWFSQNIDASHPKLTAIPIGLDYHTIADGKIEPWWGEKETPVVQEKFIINLEKPPFEERKLNIYCNFKNSIRGRFGEKDRKTSLIQIPQDLLIIENEKITRKKTWKNMTKYAFVLSPHGNGLDCHRTWEALVLGCIPIVKKSSLDILYEDLPVLIVDNWSDINKEMLQNTIDNYSKAEFNYDKLTLKYWINLITSYRDEI